MPMYMLHPSAVIPAAPSAVISVTLPPSFPLPSPRHSRAGGNPAVADRCTEAGFWVPACAGTTGGVFIPAAPSAVISVTLPPSFPLPLPPSFPLSFPRHSRCHLPVIPAQAGIQRWLVVAPRLASGFPPARERRAGCLFPLSLPRHFRYPSAVIPAAPSLVIPVIFSPSFPLPSPRHSRAGGNPAVADRCTEAGFWVPACAGTTGTLVQVTSR